MTSTNLTPAKLRDYADQIEADLRQNILPFWIRHAVDRERGGFLGSLTNDLAADPRATRGALLTSRILWTFSAAYRRHGDATYLEMADRAYSDLMSRFLDREHGGFFWEIDASGAPCRTRKQVYGQAFAVYALSEYHRASGRPEPLSTAVAIFRLIEKHARDRRFGGYFEAFARDWQPIEDVRLSEVDLNEPKSQNTHLHVMEAYANLLQVWPDPELRAAQAATLEVMLTRILIPTGQHLGLFFATDWTPRSPKISYGHDIEASWLLTEAAAGLGDAAVAARIRPAALSLATATLAQGLDTDGAVFNEGGPAGLTDTNKEWWPQAEAVVGFLNAYELSANPADTRRAGDQRYLEAALHAWDFIAVRLIDRKNGEWFRGVTRGGKLLSDQLKVSFWKCPYHNGRTGLEAPARLRAIADRMMSS